LFLSNHRSRRWLLLALVSLVMLGISCRLLGGNDSPAPGCNEGIGGGCFGRTVILGMQVQPEIECLRIKTNNCNGGVLEVYNGCEDVLVLAGHEILPGDYPAFDLAETGDGGYRLVEVESNFSEYLPDTDRSVTVSGKIDGQVLNISFTKTAPFCEESQ